jgi:hypothetical protein
MAAETQVIDSGIPVTWSVDGGVTQTPPDCNNIITLTVSSIIPDYVSVTYGANNKTVTITALAVDRINALDSPLSIVVTATSDAPSFN